MAAAMRAKLATLITAVESPEQWDEIVSGLGKKLLVVDLHKKWCGPCEVMRPIFERIFLNTDECENRCSFVSGKAAWCPCAGCCVPCNSLQLYAQDAQGFRGKGCSTVAWLGAPFPFCAARSGTGVVWPHTANGTF